MKNTNKIIFGTACYLLGNTIRIRKRQWNHSLPSGKSWKQPYVAELRGVDLSASFIRAFYSRTDVMLGEVDALEWNLVPYEGACIEFGWVYDNVHSYDANTHYLINVDGMWIEVSKERMIKNVSVIK